MFATHMHIPRVCTFHTRACTSRTSHTRACTSRTSHTRACVGHPPPHPHHHPPPPLSALDYLVGFNISPVLWRRLVRAKSAGRVQSVALRLITDREMAIEQHNPPPHWVLRATLAHADGTTFSAVLTMLHGQSLTKNPLATEAAAQEAAALLRGAELHVAGVTSGEVQRAPPPAFTTSTMQQEASQRLGLNPSATMQIAQSLYEGTIDQGILFIDLVCRSLYSA